MGENSKTMLDTLVTLQSQSAGEGGMTPEQQVMGVAKGLASQVPKLINIADIRALLLDDPSPLNIVLLQESGIILC